MLKRALLILISISLIFFFIAPLFVFAEEVNWPLKEKEVQDLLDIIRKKPLTDANEDLFFESLRYVFSDYPRKTGAVVLVKQAILKKQLDYWLKGIPWEISKTFLKTALKLVPLLYGAPDIGTVIKLIEQFTVQEATKYVTNWFLQNEIKIGTGKGNYTFPSYQNNWQIVDIPYIIAYHPTSKTQGRIVAEFYSKNPIEPPIGTGPNALGRTEDNLQTNCWPHDRWQENEKQRNNDGKLEPFIVRVKGPVIRDRWGSFSWDKTKAEPIVEVEFDKPVPQIAQSDIIWQSETVKKYYFIVEKILKPVMDKLQATGEKIKAAPQALKTKFIELGAKTMDLMNKIQSYFGEIKPEAQIGGLERAGAEVENGLAKLTEEAVALGKEATYEVELRKLEQPVVRQPSLDELIEQFDEISERTEMLLANAQTFLWEKEAAQTHNKIGHVSDFVMAEESAEGTENAQDSSAPLESQNDKQEEKVEEPEETLKTEEPEAQEKEIEERIEKITFCALSGSQSPARNRVVFNEIAWMGSVNSSNDEWIELRNISSQPIDLNGWQILDKDSQIKVSFQNVALIQGGFFLLERTDDSSVPFVPADLIYTGTLNNTAEALYLFDKNCLLQDKAEANPYWPAGSNSSKKTMERRFDLAWQTSRDVGGTPKVSNSPGEIYYTGGGGGAVTPSPAESSKGPAICSQENLPSPIHSPVILNEIAWMGGISWLNEWIELKNVSKDSVSLNGWQILDKDEQIKIFFDGNDSISANSFYLLEREEGAVPDMSADKIYSGYLNNDNESLRLFDENCNLIDEVLASPDWPSGDNLEKRSMERAPDLSWHTFASEAGNGILGTPRQENSQPSIPDTEPPRAEAGPNQTVEIHQALSLDGASSTDNIGITSFAWDIDENNGLDWETPDLTGQSPTLETGYSATGTYVVTLQVADEAGNSATDTLNVFVNSPPELLISEVQITGETVSDEFVELYNPNSFDLDLTGFSLKKRTSEGSESNLVSAAKFSGTIPSLGYFLITPQDKETGDLLYSGKTYSIAANNTILLYSKYNNLIDETPAINHPKNYSLGRKWSTTTLTYQDFELQIPTPGAQNEKDLTAPVVDIISAPPILTNQTTATFSFSANEENCALEYKLDDNPWQEDYKISRPWDFVIFGNLTDGEHIFWVKAIDPAGNVSEPATSTWTVDTTIESPSLSLQDSDSTSTTYTNNQTVKVEITQDEEAAAWFLSENSERPATNTTGWLNIKPATSTLSASDPSASSGQVKTVYIWTKDQAENISPLGNSASIILDTISPQVFIEEKPDNPSNQATTTFTFSCSEENCVFEYKLDDNAWQKDYKTPRPWDFVIFGTLTEGEHFFQVKATDQAGNLTATSSQYAWLYNPTPPNQAPTPYFSYSPKENLLVEDEIAFDAASSTDPNGSIVSYAWNFGDSNSTTTERATTTHSYATSGDYTVLLTISDNDGATSSTSTTIYIMPKPPLFLTVTFPSQNQVSTSSSPDTSILPGFQTITEGTTTAQALVSVSRATTTIATTTASTIGKWELEITLEQGENVFVFRAEDKFGQIATTSLDLVLDTTPPIKITDLSATGFDIDAIELSWTSPQDAVQYEIRFLASTAIDESNWDLAQPTQTSIVSGLFSNTIYYFAIKSKDENGNISEISNVASAKTLNQAPIATFTYPPENYYIGQEITFDASDSYDPDDDPISFSWNFGDDISIITISEIITHSFATAGEFSVVLVVQDSEGATSSPATAFLEVAEKPKPKILITEVQIVDSESTIHDFVELYNPTDRDIYLGDCNDGYIKLVKRTSTGVENKNIKSWRNDSEAKITAKGYYLWASSEDENYPSSINADAWTKQIVSADNGIALSFIRDEEEFIIDAVGCGDFNNVLFEGVAFPQNPEANQSIGRKWATTTQEYKDTDNNQEDFELQTPTPKAQNQALPQNQAPTASFTYTPQSPQIDQVVLFNAASSTDSDGIITAYTWDFGDSSSTTTDSTTTTHVFNTLGQFQITLIVTDNQGATSTPATTTIEVAAPLPPGSVQNFAASPTNNTVTLSWSTSTDLDSPAEDISYLVYYAKAGETEATTSATTTSLTLTDLYYDSTYNFGIKAYDGLNYSELTTTSLTIAPETPQWQMFGHDPYHTFQSPYTGPSTSTTKWTFALPGQTKTGPAIDQNGTIYLGVTNGLLALKEENGQPEIKWSFPVSDNFFGSPLIGSDGTIYIINGNNILAISPAGSLRWRVELTHTIDTTNPSRENRLNLKDGILYLSASYWIEGKRRPLLIAFNKDTGALLWVFDLAEEQKYTNFDQVAAPDDIQSSPSLPTIGKEGNVYVGFGPTLFAIDSNGNLQWKKTLQIKDGWEDSSQPTFGAISVDEEGTVYFVIHDRVYETWWTNFLYALKPGSVDTSTTTVTFTETKWDAINTVSSQGPILVANNGTLYLIVGIPNASLNLLYEIAADGTWTQPEPQLTGEVYSFLPQFIDSQNKLYGQAGGSLSGFAVLNSSGSKLVFYFNVNDKFIFPFALSKEGVLFAPAHNYLYALAP